MFNLELDRRFERLSLGASVHAEGRRYDDPANKVRLGGYATLDLRSEYRLNDEWRLQGGSPTCSVPTTKPRMATTSLARRSTSACATRLCEAGYFE